MTQCCYGESCRFIGQAPSMQCIKSVLNISNENKDYHLIDEFIFGTHISESCLNGVVCTLKKKCMDFWIERPLHNLYLLCSVFTFSSWNKKFIFIQKLCVSFQGHNLQIKPLNLFYLQVFLCCFTLYFSLSSHIYQTAQRKTNSHQMQRML